MNITSNQPVLRYGGKALPLYDAVIPRIGASVTHYGLAVLRQFEMQGRVSAQRERGHRPVARQAEGAAASRARRHRIACHRLRPQAQESRERPGISEVGGAPVVIKLVEGTQAMGVILAETEASAKSIVEAFSTANIDILCRSTSRKRRQRRARTRGRRAGG